VLSGSVGALQVMPAFRSTVLSALFFIQGAAFTAFDELFTLCAAHSLSTPAGTASHAQQY
jgi:hypothetical protein